MGSWSRYKGTPDSMEVISFNCWFLLMDWKCVKTYCRDEDAELSVNCGHGWRKLSTSLNHHINFYLYIKQIHPSNGKGSGNSPAPNYLPVRQWHLSRTVVCTQKQKLFRSTIYVKQDKYGRGLPANRFLSRSHALTSHAYTHLNICADMTSFPFEDRMTRDQWHVPSVVELHCCLEEKLHKQCNYLLA